ncbi:MAG: hypothetical protein JWM18_1341 [Chloroflexi bacterium]|nr:hypothetical protein [Chloroflexota bacterium]
MSWWVRADGAERWLEHLDGPPAELPPPTAWERFGDRLDALHERLPWWDDALIRALLLFVVAGALALCGLSIVHLAVPHASAAHHGPTHPPAMTAVRVTVGPGVPAVGSAPLRRPSAPAAMWASEARWAGGSASRRTAPSSDGGMPVTGPLQADAYGVNLDPVATCLSCTTAQAGRNSSAAEGREFRLAGESVCEGQVPANGYANGTLVALPSNPLLRLAVAEWDGYATANRDASRSHARGALLDFAFGDGGIATVTIGDSTSDATYRGSASHASSDSNGARAALGGRRLTLVVLHSEGSSDAPGHAYLASLNGEEVMASNRAGDDNGVTVPRVTSVALLHSDGSGGLLASASDGRAQRVATVGTTWVGRPSADPQPLQ